VGRDTAPVRPFGPGRETGRAALRPPLKKIA
jgi:hypothetical protein